MLKLTGSLLLMTGCTGLGINKVMEEKKRIRELREIRRMTVRIQNEMTYGKRTLPEICLLFGQCMEEPYRSAFLTIFQKMEENHGTAFEKIWKEETGKCMRDLPLKEEEKNILQNLPEHMGLLEETMQAADIGQSLDMISEHIARAEAEYENKTKVIMSVSVMAGLFLVILLL